MGKVVRNQINFNTILLIILGALVSLGVRKADMAFTQLTILTERENDMGRRMDNVESILGIFVPRTNKRKE